MNQPPDLPPNIVNHYEDPYHFGQCESCTHMAEVADAACGDTVVVQLRVADDEVVEAWFDGEGCHVSQAAASMLMEFIEGKFVAEIEQFSKANMFELIGAELDDGQRTCCLLPLQVMHAAIRSRDEIDEDAQGATFTGPDLGDEC